MRRSCFAFLLGTGLWFTGAAVAQEDAAARAADNGATKAAPAQNEHPEFLRIKKGLTGPVALETAIAPYLGTEQSKYPKARVDLIGAVHIGSRSYYEELNRRFKDYDILLYELVAEEGTKVTPADANASRSPVSAMQVGMRDLLELDFQLEIIDYQAPNFRHADMTPDEFVSDMTERGDSLVQTAFRMMGAGLAMQSSGKGGDAGILIAMLAPDRTRQLRRAMARQFQDLEATTAGMASADGKSTLITQRNIKALQVLRRELDAGHDRIGIFYGAGHLPDFGKRLVNDFGMKADVKATEYIEAWDLR